MNETTEAQQVATLLVSLSELLEKAPKGVMILLSSHTFRMVSTFSCMLDPVTKSEAVEIRGTLWDEQSSHTPYLSQQIQTYTLAGHLWQYPVAILDDLSPFTFQLSKVFP